MIPKKPERRVYGTDLQHAPKIEALLHPATWRGRIHTMANSFATFGATPQLLGTLLEILELW